ncbi:hypothetical protein GC194_05230 [bacterium]|nr:hypothetical protein [bacterium]
MNQYVIFALLWAAYFAFHSLLASNLIKSNFNNKKSYRLFFNAFALLSLLPLFWYQLGIDRQLVFEPTLSVKIPAVGLGYVAFVVFKKAAQVYDMKAFAGFAKEQESSLKTDGILQRVRHPFYTATVALGLGYWLWSPTIGNAIMVGTWFLYLPIGVWLEEKKLVAAYGEAYLAYRQQTPAVLPRLFKR